MRLTQAESRSPPEKTFIPLSSIVPVLCLQGAGQVFSVWVTEGVGQTILVADFLAVGFGLWGAAFTLREITQRENTFQKNVSEQTDNEAKTSCITKISGNISLL